MTRAQDEALAFHNRTLAPAEARAYLDAPVSDAEREEVRTLVQWFTRRYPTPAERLAYVRRAYARWHRAALEPSTAPSPPRAPETRRP